jgi:GntR family transcriptional regulator
MLFRIIPGDELPIYRQIMRQIVDAIAAGRLAKGDKLPSHRDLAGTLVIAPLTVKKAYDELELQGVIETRRGKGTFVATTAPRGGGQVQRERLRSTAERLLVQAHMIGLHLPEVIALLTEVDEELVQSTNPEPDKEKGHER